MKSERSSRDSRCQAVEFVRRSTPNRRRWFNPVASVLAFVAAIALAGASEVPLGHPDFYPSPQRPIGWRGDGTGAWPGASPVTNWNPDTGANVVWRSPMPAPSFSQPVEHCEHCEHWGQTTRTLGTDNLSRDKKNAGCERPIEGIVVEPFVQV